MEITFDHQVMDYFLNDEGKVVFSIAMLQDEALGLIAQLVNTGYEQASCNEERMVDFGDAIRIVTEDLRDNDPRFWNIAPESLRLLGTFLTIYARTRWEREFPGNVAVGY